MTQTWRPALRRLHLTGKPLTGGWPSDVCRTRGEEPSQNAQALGDSMIGRVPELCGWQGLGAPAWCQAWASEMGEPRSGHWTTRDLPAPRNINWQELSQRSPSQCWDPAPPNGQQAAVLDAPCQTTSRTGTQTHPLAESLPKMILSSQTPQNTPLDAALPTRKRRFSPTHQNTGTVPSTRKPTQATEPTLRTEGRHQKQWELGTCSLWKGECKHSKLSNMRWQRNTQQMKEQGKNPPDQTNEEEIDSLPEKEFRAMIVEMIKILETEWRKYKKRSIRT